MIVDQQVKQPYEEFPYAMDFSAELDLDAGEKITSAAVTAKNYATLQDSSAAVLLGTHAISADGTTVTQMVRAGAHGETHLIEFKVSTNTTPPGKYEAEVEVLVAES